MTNPGIYLAPCDNPQLNRLFKKIILNGIKRKYYQEYVQDDYGDNLYFWGVTEQKGKRHSHIESGDFLLFYSGDDQYTHAAKTHGIEKNDELIKFIKSDMFERQHDVEGLDRWEYCIYLQEPFLSDLDSRRLHDYAGHSSNRPFNFTKMNNQGISAIKQEHGSVESYLRSENSEQSDNSANKSNSDSVRQFNSIEEVVSTVSQETKLDKSTIHSDVSKLDQRNIPFEIICKIVHEKYTSNSENSILSVDAVGAVRGARLYHTGYDSIESLVDVPISKLSDIPEISKNTGRVIKEHVQEIVSNESTAKQIASQSGDDISEIKKTLRVVGSTGVPRSKAQTIVGQLHTHPSLLDIPRVQRRAAYYLMDNGYETAEDIVESSREDLLEVPHVGENNVEMIQKDAAEYSEEVNIANQTSDPVRLADLKIEQKQEVAQILGVENIDELSDEEWESVLSRFFVEIINSPFDFQFDPE